MYTRSDNVETMFGDDNDDIIEQLFKSLLQKYEENLQNKMRGSEFEAKFEASTSKDWKKFESNNKVALNMLYVPYNAKKINIAYKSKNNLTQERQIILLMISDGQKWHYLVVKNLSGLLRGITSNHKENFYCLNCFHSYSTENKIEAHKKICENHDYCCVEMPTKNNNIINTIMEKNL